MRDLTFLLNATNLDRNIDRARFAYAGSSSLNYGVPSLAGVFAASRGWPEIEHVIRRAIVEFEPRLMPNTLEIIPMQDESELGNYNVIIFEVSGLIRTPTYPLEFRAHSVISIETGKIRFEDPRTSEV